MLCPLGMLVFGRATGPCPALSYNQDGGSQCGLVMAPREFAPVKAAIYGERPLSMAAYVLIGAAEGCDGLREDEPVNEEVQRARERFRHISGKQARRAHKAMGIWGLLP
jgi:hypothetical protein